MTPELAKQQLSASMRLWEQQGRCGEIAYFGGTFTGLSREEMTAYLSLARPYIENGTVDGIRISTRPDMISQDILELLKEYGVTHIELGVQSMEDAVLQKAGRCYTSATVEHSAKLISEGGFSLGLQMMTALPGDTKEKSLATAQKIIALGAEETRIYPTLVIRDTPLAELYKQGKYIPADLDETVNLCAELKQLFDSAGVTVLKIGLHSTIGEDVIAGPYHPAFGQLVNSHICLYKLKSYIKENTLYNTELFVTSREYSESDIIGHKRANADFLQNQYKITLKLSKKELTNSINCIIL